MEHGTLTQEFYLMMKKIDKLVKEHADGLDYFQKRTLSINSCHKADDGTYIFIGTSKLHGPVRDTKNKTKRIR